MSWRASSCMRRCSAVTRPAAISLRSSWATSSGLSSRSSAPTSMVRRAASSSAAPVSTTTYAYGAPREPADRLGQLRPVHAGHLPVGDHHVGQQLLVAAPGLAAVLGDRAAVPELLHGGAHEQPRARVVVGDQDVHWLSDYPHAPVIGQRVKTCSDRPISRSDGAARHPSPCAQPRRAHPRRPGAGARPHLGDVRRAARQRARLRPREPQRRPRRAHPEPLRRRRAPRRRRRDRPARLPAHGRSAASSSRTTPAGCSYRRRPGARWTC